MAALFQPDRSLLHPQFETYRLHSLDPSTDVSSYRLPGNGATQSRVGYNTHLLSFKETRARIAFDHLAVYGRLGVYVDAEWNVVGLRIGDDLVPSFTTLVTLPTPISSSEASQHPEYPSVLALSATTWLISTGSGSIYVLELSSSDELFGSIIARYDSEVSSIKPFSLLAAHLASPTSVRVILSSTVPKGSKGDSTSFELTEIEIDPTHYNAIDDAPETFQSIWTLSGGDVPVWVEWGGEGWVVLSSEAFNPPGGVAQETESDREKMERRERVEKLGLGASLSEIGGHAQHGDGEQPEAEAMDVDESPQEGDTEQWPFSWTQNSESVSVTIPLPADTSRKDIEVELTATTLSLHLSPSIAPTPPLSAFLSRQKRAFWGTTDPSTSTFSFNESQHSLELELAKVYLNTRWPSVFSPEDEEDDDEVDIDVPETLDPNILASVRESFNNIKTRTGDEPAGNHPAIPALLREEMDYDLEDGEDFGEDTTGVFGEPQGGRVGRDVFVGYIKDGIPTWSKSQAFIVSLPIAGNDISFHSGDATGEGEDRAEGFNGVMVKSAVDGLLFLPSSAPSRSPWKHISTSPALSFVLSSKRDLRSVRHLINKTGPGATVLAFDAGGSTPASGNVYVYYPPAKLNATTARQGVIRVSGGERGALLGTGVVDVNGRQVVIALCEKELVVLHGVLDV